MRVRGKGECDIVLAGECKASDFNFFSNATQPLPSMHGEVLLNQRREFKVCLSVLGASLQILTPADYPSDRFLHDKSCCHPLFKFEFQNPAETSARTTVYPR